MTEHEAVSILKNLGWSCKSNEVGDRFCTRILEERVVRIFPTIGKRTDHFRVTFMPSVSSRKFSEFVSFISGEGVEYEPLIVSNETPEKLTKLGIDDIHRLSQESLSWALNQDIEKGLANYRNLPTNAKGAMPLRHLAALAIAGDVNQLSSYQRSFEQGDRLEFVPYITTEMIERALLLARNSDKTSS